MTLPMKEQSYTYADYCTWDDDRRRELIDGVIYAMSPAPSRTHQRILFELSRQFGNFLKGKPCEAFHAPFDVRLNGLGDDDDAIVQPDLVVVCDQSKLDEKGCNGAPDMVVEILSPSTASRDKVLKFNAYQRAGVREYWIVDPESKTLSAHMLTDSGYMTRTYGETESAPAHILEGCEISLPDVFE